MTPTDYTERVSLGLDVIVLHGGIGSRVVVWLSSDEVGEEVLALMLAEHGIDAQTYYRGASGRSFARGVVTEAKSLELAAAVIARGGSVL